MSEEDFRVEMAAWWNDKMMRLFPESRPKKPRVGRPQSLERGRWHSCESAAGLPMLPGVYVIIIDREVLYIGQSERLRSRLQDHGIKLEGNMARTPWGDFAIRNNFSIKFKISRRLGDWAMWEVRLIKKLNPRCNSKGKPLAVLSGALQPVVMRRTA